MKRLTYFSMFAGIGGFELGFEQAYADYRLGLSKQKAKNLRGRKSDTKSKQVRQPVCAGYSEIDPHAIKVYERHFPNHENYGDCRTINPRRLPDFDLLVGGFPCQAFSIAGKRQGFADTRGTLFFDLARIARARQPRLLLLENVKGLLSHDQGNTFRVILAALDELGYHCQWQVLDSKDFGVPQHRERVFIVGHLGGTPRPQVFPLGESGALPLETNGRKQKGRERISSTLDARYGSLRNSGETYIEHKPIADTLTAWGAPELKQQLPKVSDTRGFNQPKSWDYPEVFGKTTEKEKQLLTMILRTRRTQASRYPDRDGSAVKVKDITTAQRLVRKGYLVDDGNGWFDLARTSGKVNDAEKVFGRAAIRRLTPTECERLQGFPGGWTEGISDTQRYKCLGNAVTVSVVKEIAKRLIQSTA